jgi:hypothetical protein
MAAELYYAVGKGQERCANVVGFANLAVMGILIIVMIVAIAIDDRRYNRNTRYKYMEFNLGIQKIIPDSIEEHLMDLEIELCESLGLGMGGSPYDFSVENMTSHQAKWFSEAINSYLKSHDIIADIKYKERTDEDD